MYGVTMNERMGGGAGLDPPGERAAGRVLASLALMAAGVALALLLNGCASGDAEKRLTEQADFHYKLANNFFYDHNTVMAIRECYAALEIDPNHADAHHLLGFLYFGRKQYADAISHFQKAIEAREDFYEAVTNLGAVYLAQKRWEEAIEQFEKLTRMQLYPTPSVAHVNLGWALYNLRRYSEALEHYKLALFLNPQLCLGHNNLGLLYEAMGDETLAVECFERAAKACPRYAEPLFHMGRLLAAAGQMGRASEAFTKCHELEPESQLGRRCRTRRL